MAVETIFAKKLGHMHEFGIALVQLFSRYADLDSIVPMYQSRSHIKKCETNIWLQDLPGCSRNV